MPLPEDVNQSGTEGLYTVSMERKIFWLTFASLGLVADFVLPLWVGSDGSDLCVRLVVGVRSGWY